ncbi:BLOC-1-related complex subunit 5-like isoform X2 [Ornithodoros turicata]|uniref:BLOC-1-related complex subunit 5 n=1 Tax=Ornithodoros turicata TaxID=34597 RepID=A0A2R5L5B0_9ACAR
MGIEQSSHAGGGSHKHIKGNSAKASSPRPSISSDSDVPYISSTVNNPIGGHDIVVVKEGNQDLETVEADEDLLKLQRIPLFYPILRGTLHSPIVRDPDVLERLDNQAVSRLASRYQEHLRQCADVVSTEQNAIATRIREIDYAISTLSTMLTDRQKKFVKHAEQFSKVHELSSMLNNSQAMLDKTIEQVEELNKLLPLEEQLEPFVMVTG